ALEHKTDYVEEFRVVWPDGTIHWLAAHGRALYSPEGKPTRMSGVSLDITNSKKSEQALSFLAAIVESSDDAVVGKDLHGAIVSWNAGAERMYGYAAAEMLGQPVTRLLPPDRSEEEDQILEEVRRGEIRHLETVRVRKDGRPIEVSLTVSPIKNS